jgi:hypothetical protein
MHLDNIFSIFCYKATSKYTVFGKGQENSNHESKIKQCVHNSLFKCFNAENFITRGRKCNEAVTKNVTVTKNAKFCDY